MRRKRGPIEAFFSQGNEENADDDEENADDEEHTADNGYEENDDNDEELGRAHRLDTTIVESSIPHYGNSHRKRATIVPEEPELLQESADLEELYEDTSSSIFPSTPLSHAMRTGVQNVAKNKRLPKLVYIAMSIACLLILLVIFSAQFAVRNVYLVANYESEAAFELQNAWNSQIVQLRESGVDIHKTVQTWISQWRIYGHARMDGRYHSSHFGPSLAIEHFDSVLRNYTAKHLFGCSALLKMPIQFPIPKACACIRNGSSVNTYYFFHVYEKSKEQAAALEEYHYLPAKKYAWAGPRDIKLRYTTSAMNEIYEERVVGESVICILRCVKLTDNVDYLSNLLCKGQQ